MTKKSLYAKDVKTYTDSFTQYSQFIYVMCNQYSLTLCPYQMGTKDVFEGDHKAKISKKRYWTRERDLLE